MGKSLTDDDLINSAKLDHLHKKTK